MKKLLLVIMLAVCSVSLWAKDLQTAVFKLDPPMHCENCENKVMSNLRFEKGIKSIDASAKRGDVTIKYDPDKTTPEAVIKAFGKIGYKATLSEGKDTRAVCPAAMNGCCKEDQKKDIKCDKKKDCPKK